MSHSASLLSNVIGMFSHIPLVQTTNELIVNLAQVFNEKTQNSETRLGTIIVATILTATAIFGLNCLLGRSSVYFIRKALLPTVEWSCKAGLLWVIFRALDSTCYQTGFTYGRRNSLDGFSPESPRPVTPRTEIDLPSIGDPGRPPPKSNRTVNSPRGRGC